MNIKYMINQAQRALEKRYGFKPSLASIRPLETDYEGYIRFYVGDHEYSLFYGRLEDIGSFPGREMAV